MKISNINLVLCHRLPNRTFKLGNSYFPVCARCTGVYVGAFIFLIYILIFGLDNLKAIIFDINIIIISTIIIIPTFIDGTTQLIGYRESNNILRCITGIFAGVGLAVLSTSLKFSLLTLIPF